jgi:hypothetical protein
MNAQLINETWAVSLEHALFAIDHIPTAHASEIYALGVEKAREVVWRLLHNQSLEEIYGQSTKTNT